MKCIVSMGYTKYVVDLELGVAFLKLMSQAERYEAKYHYSEEGKPITYHIWKENSPGDESTLTLLSEEVYNVAKLAGEPQK